MIRAYYLDDGELSQVSGLEDVGKAWAEKRPIWVMASCEDGVFLDQVAKFHPLAVEECRRKTPVPKVEDFGSYLFSEMHIPMIVGDKLVVYELDMFLAKDFLVIYCQEEIPGLNLDSKSDAVAKRVAKPVHGARFVVRRIITELWEIIQDVEDRMDAIEALLYKRDLSHMLFNRIIATNALMGRLRNLLLGQQRIIEELVDEARGLFSEQDIPYLLDLVDRHNRLVSEAEYLQQRGETLYQIFVDLKDYESNEVMKMLTIVATVTLPAMLVAGIYGMNFKHMPELAWPWAYPVVLALMLGIGVYIFIYVKKKKWM